MKIRAIYLAAAVLIGAAPASLAADGDAAAGQRLFGRCTACHSITPGKNGIGPALDHVVGRQSASVAGYSYSPALKNSGVVWDEASLDKFLQSPVGFVRGTKMFTSVANAGDRSNLIAYLKTLSP
jgi:cytochrome c2